MIERFDYMTIGSTIIGFTTNVTDISPRCGFDDYNRRAVHYHEHYSITLVHETTIA
jgi:hypothetical protein